jgi:hypothetical protein
MFLIYLEINILYLNIRIDLKISKVIFTELLISLKFIFIF